MLFPSVKILFSAQLTLIPEKKKTKKGYLGKKEKSQIHCQKWKLM